MNKRDRMLSLLSPTYEPDGVPAAFFLHFDSAYHQGRPAAEKHLEFFRFTEMDFLKIQFEQRMPRIEIESAGDWDKLPFFGEEFFRPSIELVEELVKAAGGDALVLLTLYSPFMLATQVATTETTVRHIHTHPTAVKRAIDRIAEGMLELIGACIARGIDGFYASTQGGEAGRFTDPRSFAECVTPADLTILEEIDRRCIFNILHVCDYHLPYADLSPFAGYPGSVVNASLDLTTGRVGARDVAAIFNRPFMGGLDRKGVIAHGAPDQIRSAVRQAIESAPPRFILGADCTVPSDTPWENLRTAVRAAHDGR